MNTEVVSSAKPTIHVVDYSLAEKTNTHPVGHPTLTKSISFPSQIAKSRFSIGSPSRPGRSRVKAQVQALYAPAAAETLYEVLGITEAVSVSLPEIKKAYKQMARKYHPDVSPPDRVDEYTNKFIMVHEAYETLSNPQTRASYDRDLAAGFPFTRRQSYQGMDETAKWRTSWHSQLDELKRGSARKDSTGNMSWAARMRNQRV